VLSLGVCAEASLRSGGINGDDAGIGTVRLRETLGRICWDGEGEGEPEGDGIESGIGGEAEMGGSPRTICDHWRADVFVLVGGKTRHVHVRGRRVVIDGEVSVSREWRVGSRGSGS
jgi:hypothetical protein